MIDRRLKNVHPKDLAFVVLYGLFLPFIFGIVGGLADYYVSESIGFGIGHLIYWVVALYVGGVVRKQYEDPHLVYVLITFVGMLLSAVVIYAVPTVLILSAITENPAMVFNPLNYLIWGSYLLNPLNWILYFDLSLAFWLLSIGVGTYLGLRKTF
ncbi:MAG: hypothetical protein V1761_02535 [bacterium]